MHKLKALRTRDGIDAIRLPCERVRSSWIEAEVRGKVSVGEILLTVGVCMNDNHAEEPFNVSSRKIMSRLASDGKKHPAENVSWPFSVSLTKHHQDMID